MAILPSDTMTELSQVNEELARLLDCAPSALVSGAENAQQDTLVVCGLLGGKDVGKSTLINALAGEEISVDREEVGAGTSRPIVYVHRDMVEAARKRLGDMAVLGGGHPARLASEADLQFFPHQADAIRNVVLVDLPDFDSDFRQHEAVARAVAPGLDRVLWVVTPRKIADRAWVAFARDVVKATSNVYFALNKSDELLADEEGWSMRAGSPVAAQQHAEQFARGQRQWACATLQQAGYDVQEDRLFLIAAEYPRAAVFVQRVAAIWDDPQWQRYQTDRDVVGEIGQRFTQELQRLHEAVLAPVDPELTARIKAENLRAQHQQNVLRVREHFELDHWKQQLARTVGTEYRQSLLNAAFGPEFCRTLAGRLLRSRRADVELADEVMDARASRWPILRTMYWLSRWAVRRVGRAMTGSAAREVDRSLPAGDAMFRIRARSMADRAAAVADRVRTEHGPVARQFALEPRLPEHADLAAQAEAELAELPVRGDEELVDRLSQEYRPSPIGRLFVFAVLLWFPFVQPIADGLLQMSAAGTSLTDWLHGLHRLVVALGAVQLLHGLLVVALIYVAVLAAIYGRCVRDVQAGRQTQRGGLPARSAGEGKTQRRRRAAAANLQQEVEALAQDIDSTVAADIIGPMLRPFEVAAGQLADLTARLDGIDTKKL